MLDNSITYKISYSSFSDILKFKIFFTTGLPFVRVPVLSNAMASRLPIISSALPPLISTLSFAALAIALKTALGVEIANAQGLPATRTSIAL